MDLEFSQSLLVFFWQRHLLPMISRYIAQYSLHVWKEFQNNKIILYAIQCKAEVGSGDHFIVHRVGRALCLQTIFELVEFLLRVLVPVLKPQEVKFTTQEGWNSLSRRDTVLVQR